MLPGRHALDPGTLAGSAPAPLYRCAARDPVAALPLAEGGLLSYQHEDGTWTHTLCDPDGFSRKLRQLGLDEAALQV